MCSQCTHPATLMLKAIKYNTLRRILLSPETGESRSEISKLSECVSDRGSRVVRNGLDSSWIMFDSDTVAMDLFLLEELFPRIEVPRLYFEEYDASKLKLFGILMCSQDERK